MKTYMKATNPDRIEFSLTITLELKEWKELQEQLSRDYPSWELSSKITSMIGLAISSFEPEDTA